MLTLGVGKLFHPGLPPQADAPYSWSFGDASDPTNLSIPYVAPGDSFPFTPPRVLEPSAIAGCVNQSGEVRQLNIVLGQFFPHFRAPTPPPHTAAPHHTAPRAKLYVTKLYVTKLYVTPMLIG